MPNTDGVPLAAHSADEVLIQFVSNGAEDVRSQALEAIGGRLLDVLADEDGAQLVRAGLGEGMTVEKALQILSHLPGVAFVEPDYILTPESTSNDTLVVSGSTWGLYGDTGLPANTYGSQATEAWAVGYTGTTKVAVGVIDTGVDYRHPDLYLNIWLNQNEIPVALKSSLKDVNGDGLITFRDLNDTANAAYVTDKNANSRIDAGDLLTDTRWENGVDEDANGYRDDLIGWDFKNNDNDPLDDAGHGTHVAGTIGASGGNGVGVAGIGWSTQIVALKFMDANGGLTSDALRAADYFTNQAKNAHGVDFTATNNSWGGGAFSQSLLDAITRGAKQQVLFVAAAGNGGSDSVGDNNDNSSFYPSAYTTVSTAGYEAVIGVAAIDKTGALASFSNYGAKTVDLAAPGAAIYSTTLGGGYAAWSGTSMATPHVAGAIALYSAYAGTSMSAAQIRADLLATTISTSSLIGKTVTGGRLNVSGLLAKLGGAAPTPPPPAGVTITGTSAADSISLLASVLGQPLPTEYADTLSGLDGNDTLDGAAGADSLIGGAGDDTYVVDNAGDLVVEAAGAGTDLVKSSLSLTLAENTENLTLTGVLAINGTGNELNNIILGNGAANVLTGGVGNDQLKGNAGDDTLNGGEGNDILTGGTGADRMDGGNGADIYYVDSIGDVVVEASATGGTDKVKSSISYTLGANVENLDLTGTAAINGVGNGLANVMSGNDAANSLSGLTGIDSLLGDGGDDTLNGGAGADVLNGGLGADTFVLVKGEAAGDSIQDFAAGDVIQLTGYSAGSTLAKGAGGATDWIITDKASGATEVIYLLNGYSLSAGEFLFG